MEKLSFLKKGYLFVFVGIFFLVLSFMPLYAFLPPNAYWEIRSPLANGEKVTLDLGFFIGGSYVPLEIYVSGGDKQVTTHLLDASNNVLQQGLVKDSSVVCFWVPNNGYYDLKVENDVKVFTQNDKQILVTVSYFLYHDLFLVLGVILFFLGLGLAVYDHHLRTRVLSVFS